MQALQAILYLVLLAAGTVGQIVVCRALAQGADWKLSSLALADCALLTFLYLGVGLFHHEAAHGHLSRRPWLNEALGHTAALLFQVSFSLYRELHWSHHRATNEPADMELIPENAHRLTPRKRARALLRLMLLGTIERGRAFKQLLDDPSARLSADLTRRARIEYVVVQAVMIGGSALWIWRLGLLSWALTYALPITAACWLFGWIQLCEHFGAGSGPFPHATRDVIPASRLGTMLCRLLFNVNYHGIHHENPSIPGDRLRAAHAAWLRDLEQRGEQPPAVYPSYRSIARQILPLLWREVRDPAQRERAATTR